jgi:hypothetical protein
MEIELQGGSILILPLNAIQSYHKLLCFVGAAYAIWISLRDFGPSLRPTLMRAQIWTRVPIKLH